jgi:hypothetical protein
MRAYAKNFKVELVVKVNELQNPVAMVDKVRTQ